MICVVGFLENMPTKSAIHHQHEHGLRPTIGWIWAIRTSIKCKEIFIEGLQWYNDANDDVQDQRQKFWDFFFPPLGTPPPRPRDRSILYIFCCQVSGKCSAGLYFRSGHSADVFLAAHGERFGRHSKSGAFHCSTRRFAADRNFVNRNTLPKKLT